MRSLFFAASLAVIGVAGCDAKDNAPAPPTTSAAPSTRPVAASARGPATVIFAGKVDAARTVGAVLADATRPATVLSAPGVDTLFASALPGRRVLLVEHAADGSIAALVTADVDHPAAGPGAGVDSGARVLLGKLPAGQYRAVDKARSAGDRLVVELARVGSSQSDVLTLRPGEEPRLVAALARLVAVNADRVAVVGGGHLRSLKLDGTGALALGGGDGHDKVADVRGDRILVSTHAGGAGDVRAVDIGGGGAIDLGQPDADEQAVAFTDAGRIVFTRRTPAGAVLVSAAPDGKDTTVLTTPDLDARPLRVVGDRVIFTSAKGALLSVSEGGAPTVLDPAAGANVRIGALRGAQLFYVCDTPHWPALRVAALDGSGVVSLQEEPPVLPFFSGVTDDGRVVYYRSLAGQIEGGRIFSVKLDGTDRRPVGTAVSTADGAPTGKGLADQDFEAITTSGRLILETEFAGKGEGSNLLVGAADSDAARLLPGTARTRFVALVE